MQHGQQKRITRSFGIVLLTLLAGCGGSSQSASPSSLPFEETTTSVAATSETSAETSSGDATSAPAGLTPEMFESMLETESGRSLLVGSIAGETGLEPEAAECLLEAIPVEMLLEAAASFLGGEGDGSLFPADQMDTITPLLDSCGIDPANFAP